MFTLLLKTVVLPLAFDSLKNYIESSDSKKDDKVLDIVKTGATYLADKSNNNLPKTYADAILNCEMKKIQG